MSYLARLAVELAARSGGIDADGRARHRRFLLAAQNSDGGFSNRDGSSDAYYTGFALRVLVLLGGIPDSVRKPLCRFLRERLASSPSPVDFLSLLFCDLMLQASGHDFAFDSAAQRQRTFEAVIEPLARDDGSFAKTERSKYGSLYNTFLITACGELLGIQPFRPDEILRFVRSRRREDGGFAEAVQMRAGGVNPTGAAVALLEILEDRDARIRRRAAEFLRSMQTSEGGFKAAERIPFADLLSTFTGFVALRHLGAADSVDRSAILRFVDSLECPEGGFRAGAWDETPDVEYTFYGLGSLALAKE